LVSEKDKKEKQEYSNSTNIEIFDSVMGAIATTTGGIESVLKAEKYDPDHLSHLINTNHRLLEAVKLGSEIIDEIVLLANRHKVGAKITGAGFGGCMIAIYHHNSEVQEFKEAINKLEEKGVSFIQAEFSKIGIL